MSDSASIHQEDSIVVRGLDKPDNLVEYELLRIRVIGGRQTRQGDFEARARDFVVHQIGGKGEIRGSGLRIFIDRELIVKYSELDA